MITRVKAFGTVLALLMGLVSFGTAFAQSSAPALTAADQALGADNSVMVSSVTAAQDGWLVVHESQADGTIVLPGIIGKTQVKAGETKNVMIKLDKTITTPAKLWPMLHIDAGQIGTYEFPGADTPVTVNGQIVMQPISVTTAAAAKDSLVAKDQTLNDNSVMVDDVMASVDGWVVVHESNADGTILLPGIIGKTQVKAGETKNLMIKLDKQVANGAKLWPMLHIDAGQIGVYEFPGADTPVTVNGQIVMQPIIASTTAQAVATPAAYPTAAAAPATMAEDSLTAGDQTIKNDTVVVGMVVATVDGWVVVHESNADGTIVLPGIIGKTQVKAGMTHNVEIKLDKQVANGAKLWPMLHIDAGQIGTYEFPGADTPVTVNGQIVMQPIIVSNDMAMMGGGTTAPGMPSTGQSDNIAMLVLFSIVSLSLLGAGAITRRRASFRR